MASLAWTHTAGLGLVTLCMRRPLIQTAPKTLGGTRSLHGEDLVKQNSNSFLFGD